MPSLLWPDARLQARSLPPAAGTFPPPQAALGYKPPTSTGADLLAISSLSLRWRVLSFETSRSFLLGAHLMA